MSLLAEARAKEKPRGGTCSVALLLDAARAKTVPFSEKEILDALAAPERGPGGLSSQAISRALAEKKVELAGPTIARHRDLRCKCPR